ncbi:MAG TPA: FtsX-like permease family protein [Stellaceae bacterium]|nr:FtsX-like permease family protein [Stellaceae bacterium]
MKFLPLIWAGLWRKRARTLFTLLSIATALLLFGLMQGVSATFDRVVEQANLNRLHVRSRVTVTAPLPIADLAQIERVPGVTGVLYYSQFGAYYRDPKNSFVAIAADPARAVDIYRELVMPESQLEALKRTRTGAAVGAKLAQRYGWRIGDRIPLQSSVAKRDGTKDWVVDVVGIYDDPVLGDLDLLTSAIFLNYPFFDEARVLDRGMVDGFVVRIANPEQAAAVSASIDSLFANSPGETETRSEREYAESRLRQVGDINLFVEAIMGAVFFTLLLLTGNTMMQSVRERIPEFAVLKTLGFTDGGLFALVMAESALLSLAAAALGMAAAAGTYPQLALINGARTAMPPIVIAWGIAAALVLALASGLPPAWRVKRLEVVDALAGR